MYSFWGGKHGIVSVYMQLTLLAVQQHRVKTILKQLTVSQGVSYDHPKSKKEISSFIAYHNLNTAEILGTRPLS